MEDNNVKGEPITVFGFSDTDTEECILTRQYPYTIPTEHKDGCYSCGSMNYRVTQWELVLLHDRNGELHKRFLRGTLCDDCKVEGEHSYKAISFQNVRKGFSGI